jgi:1-deoxy-D-xylulose-5-phosphate synthase
MALRTVNSPQDLRALPLEQLPQVAAQIRQRILEVTSKTGGHLASSLGAVELVIALHYCFDTPRDKIVFDVGHQAYAHKILTGRNQSFSTLRQHRGITGFPNKDESEYDVFTTGHSSNAVSLAYGLACARDLLPPEEYFKVIAVIGDGSLSGGLCFEGLNNAGHQQKDILVVLNTNELSIAPNVGEISTYLNKLISLPLYNRFKTSLEGFIKTRMPEGSRIIKLANKFEEGIKGLFIPGMLFEELGFRYFGPFDGHDLPLLIRTLRNIKTIKGPLLLHIDTQKGKGYAPAENDPVRFHGTGPFVLETGESPAKSNEKAYTEVFGETLIELARANNKIIGITAAMPEGTGLAKFRDAFPNRFFDVGIAEGHALCFASGLARAGFQPVVAIYSTFLQRAYDQLIEDVALQKMPVVFCIDRAGIVGEDGATHQGIFDIAYLRSTPNFVVMAPRDAGELKEMISFALSLKLPVAIRYPRGKIETTDFRKAPAKLELGKPELLEEGGDFALVALGATVGPGYEAVQTLSREGLAGTLINARFVKPLDKAALQEMCAKAKTVFSLEEGIVSGGFGGAVSETLGRAVERIALPCEFVPHGSRKELLAQYGLDAQGIAQRIRSCLKQT